MAVWSVPKLGIELLESLKPVLGQFRDCLGGLCDHLCNKLWFGCCWARNGHVFRFHNLEPMLGERAAYGQPTAQFGTVKNSPSLLDLDRKWSMCVVSKILLKLEGLSCVKEILMHENLMC